MACRDFGQEKLNSFFDLASYSFGLIGYSNTAFLINFSWVFCLLFSVREEGVEMRVGWLVVC